MAHRLKVPVCVRPAYTIEYEQSEDQTFIHCEVRRWSSRVLKELREDSTTLLRLHGGPVYALLNPHSTHAHFLGLLGFSPYGWCVDEHGNEVPAYRRTLTDGQ